MHSNKHQWIQISRRATPAPAPNQAGQWILLKNGRTLNRKTGQWLILDQNAKSWAPSWPGQHCPGRRPTPIKLRLMESVVGANRNQMITMGDDMLALSKEVTTALDEMTRDMDVTKTELNFMFSAIFHERSSKQIMFTDLKELHWALFYLMATVDTFLPLMEEERMLHEKVVQYYRDFIRDLQLLVNGRLSPSLITPAQLQTFYDLLAYQLMHKYPGHELALTTVTQMYQARVHFYYEQDHLYVIMPMALKKAHVRPIPLFVVNTVPVPVLTNQTEATVFTRLMQTPEYVAIGNRVTVELSSADLDQCQNFDQLFLCPRQAVVNIDHHETCLSSIYQAAPIERVIEVCEFQVQVNQDPALQILETSTEVLVANIKKPWHFVCEEGYEQPTVHSVAGYFLVSRAILCHCSIHGPGQIIAQHVEYCGLKETKFLFYAENRAVSFLQRESEVLASTDIRLPIPDRSGMLRFQVVVPDHQGMIVTGNKPRFTMKLRSFVEQVRTHGRVYASSSAVLMEKLHNQTMTVDFVKALKSYLPEGTAWLKYVKMAAVGAIVILVVLFLWQCCHCCVGACCFAKARRNARQWMAPPPIFRGATDQASPPRAESPDPGTSNASLASTVGSSRQLVSRARAPSLFSRFRRSTTTPFESPAVLRELRHRFRSSIETGKGSKILLGDEDDAESVRRERRLGKGGVTLLEVAHAINRSRQYAARMPIPELEAAIQRVADVREATRQGHLEVHVPDTPTIQSRLKAALASPTVAKRLIKAIRPSSRDADGAGPSHDPTKPTPYGQVTQELVAMRDIPPTVPEEPSAPTEGEEADTSFVDVDLNNPT